MRSSTVFFWLMLLGLCCPMGAHAQGNGEGKKLEPEKAAAENSEEEALYVVVYTVGNLNSPPQKAYRPFLPTTEDLSEAANLGGIGRMGGGMGGMGGGMGMFNVTDDNAANETGKFREESVDQKGKQLGNSLLYQMAADPAQKGKQTNQSTKAPGAVPNQGSSDLDDLIDAITKTIAPTTWDIVGASGSIQPYKNKYLIISQTQAVHKQIHELLKMINAGQNVANSLLIEAYWLLLDSSQLEKLRMPPSRDEKKVRITVDPKVLEEYARTVPGLRGQIACFNNQTVHIAAGDRRNILIGAIPVVGGADAGYQPVSANVNIGALLQVCPAYIPGMKSATVDIDSTVTNWREGLEPLIMSSTTPPADVPIDPTQGSPIVKQPGKTTSLTLMDHIQMPAHHLACTLKVPLGKPVLVGGLTLDPTKLEAPEVKSGNAKNTEAKTVEKKQLYLILRVCECDDE